MENKILYYLSLRPFQRDLIGVYFTGEDEKKEFVKFLTHILKTDKEIKNTPNSKKSPVEHDIVGWMNRYLTPHSRDSQKVQKHLDDFVKYVLGPNVSNILDNEFLDSIIVENEMGVKFHAMFVDPCKWGLIQMIEEEEKDTLYQMKACNDYFYGCSE